MLSLNPFLTSLELSAPIVVIKAKSAVSVTTAQVRRLGHWALGRRKRTKILGGFVVMCFCLFGLVWEFFGWLVGLLGFWFGFFFPNVHLRADMN